MPSPHQPSRHVVDWHKLPAPADDGRAPHLPGLAVLVLAPDRNASGGLAWPRGSQRP